MKKIIFTLAATIAVLLTGCTDTDDLAQPSQLQTDAPHVLQLTAAAPGTSATNTRLTIVKDPANTKDLISKWEVGDMVNIGFLQGPTFASTQTKVTTVNTDGSAVFEPVTVPVGIVTTNSYTLYAAVNGSLLYTSPNVSFVCNTGLDVSLQYLAKKIPFYCKQEVLANATLQNLSFQSVGSILSVHIKNTGTAPLPADMSVITLKATPTWNDADVVLWYSSPDRIDITNSGTPENVQPFSPPLEMNVYGLSALPAGSSITAYGWFVPYPTIYPFNLNASVGNASFVSYAATTNTTRKSITQALPQGKNIHLYLNVNMNATPATLAFVTGTDFGSIDNDLPKITLTTTKVVNSFVALGINAATEDQADVWIDFNNNGIKDTEEEISIVFGDNDFGQYYLRNQTFTLHGKITFFNCRNNLLTTLDVSGNPALTTLYCYTNDLTSLDVSQNKALTTLICFSNDLTSLDVSQNKELNFLNCSDNKISGDNMTALVNSLPDRTGKIAGTLYIYDSTASPGDSNVATTGDVKIATDKNWIVSQWTNFGWEDYPGV